MFSENKTYYAATNTGTYVWIKFFALLLKPFTSSDYTVKDSFDFAEDISQRVTASVWGFHLQRRST